LAPVLLIVMFQSGTWRARPGETLTLGRGKDCAIRLPAGDRGLSHSAGSFAFRDGARSLRNDSSTSLLHLYGDRGFRVDRPPGMHIPLEQWHAKVRLQGVLDCYALRLRLPDLDDVPGRDGAPGQADRPPAAPGPPRRGERATSAWYYARLARRASQRYGLSHCHPGQIRSAYTKSSVRRIRRGRDSASSRIPSPWSPPPADPDGRQRWTAAPRGRDRSHCHRP
jgi:hypothetical protein